MVISKLFLRIKEQEFEAWKEMEVMFNFARSNYLSKYESKSISYFDIELGVFRTPKEGVSAHSYEARQ